MRMRRKKNLESRFSKCKLIYLSKSTDIYRLEEKDRYDVVDYKKLFNNDNPVEIEIGCGKGQFLIEHAKRRKDVNFIGVEIIDNIIVSAAESAEKENLTNIQFFNCGAEILHYLIPPNSVDKIYLNFSCPYPKKQYENHRLTYYHFLNIYKTILKSGAKIVMKTDSDVLFEYSKGSFLDNGFTFENVEEDLYKNLPIDNIATEYEEKFVKEGKKIHALTAYIKE